MPLNFSRLRDALREKFGARGIQVPAAGRTIAIVEPVWSGFGTVFIEDDWNEVTVYCGCFTHVHFGNYDEGISDDERASRIAADVVDFLDSMFSDRLEFWACGRSSGGCHAVDKRPSRFVKAFSTSRGLWSRPLNDDDRG